MGKDDRHSGRSLAKTRSPVAAVIARSVEHGEGDAAIPVSVKAARVISHRKAQRVQRKKQLTAFSR